MFGPSWLLITVISTCGDCGRWRTAQGAYWRLQRRLLHHEGDAALGMIEWRGVRLAADRIEGRAEEGDEREEIRHVDQRLRGSYGVRERGNISDSRISSSTSKSHTSTDERCTVPPSRL